MGKSEKVGPTSRPDFGAFQMAVSRARPLKNILAGPDGSGGPPEPSGPAGIFFMGRARETAIWNAPRARRKSTNNCEKVGPPQHVKIQESWEIGAGRAISGAWRASCRVFRWVKRGPDAPKLLRRVCFSPENTKRPRASPLGAHGTKFHFWSSRKPLAHACAGRQSRAHFAG